MLIRQCVVKLYALCVSDKEGSSEGGVVLLEQCLSIFHCIPHLFLRLTGPGHSAPTTPIRNTTHVAPFPHFTPPILGSVRTRQVLNSMCLL